MSRATVTRNGSCPYCKGASFSENSPLRENFEKMKCNTCTRYSVRKISNFSQYPLQKPFDVTSSMTVNVVY